MTKDEIKRKLAEARTEIMEAIKGLSDQEMSEPGVVGDWSVKDILIHVNLWEAELIKLLWQVKQGQKPSTVHFSGRSDDEVNQQWYEESRDRELDQVLGDFEAVQRQILRRLEGFSDEDLNDPGRYLALQRQRGKPLSEWIAANSFDHEVEHAQQIKEWRELKKI